MNGRDNPTSERAAKRTRRETLRSIGAGGLYGPLAAAAGVRTGVATDANANTAPDAPPVEWVRTFDPPPSISSVVDVAHTPDGGYAFVGGDGPAVAGVVDADGCPRWVCTFASLPGSPNTILLVDDGEFVVGLIDSDGPVLARVDESCGVSWTASFPDPTEGMGGQYYPADVAPAPDGGYVAVGMFSYNDPIQWAAKVDDDGAVAWTDFYHICGTMGGVDSAPSGDEAAYVVGSGLIDDCDGDPAVPALSGLTADGEVAWTTTYPDRRLEDVLFARTADGGYALAGTDFNAGATVVRKLNPDRSTAWVCTYEGDDVHLPTSSLVAVPDGGLAFAGPTYTFGNAGVSVTRVSAAGDVRWRDTYAPVDGMTNLRTLLRAPDGGFVFGGSVGADRYATQSGYLTKLAPDAEAPRPLAGRFRR